MHLPEPIFCTVGTVGTVGSIGSIGEEDLIKYHALALPAFSSEQGAWIDSNSVSDQILALSSKTFSEIQMQWPDFNGKAGELIEIPITSTGRTTRLFIVGFGAGSIEESRMAGARLGRKVKSTGFSIYSAYSGNYDAAVAHILALSLSQYGWSLKSTHSQSDINIREKGETKFTFSDDLDAAVIRAKVIAKAVWITRDLIHTPSNIKNPQWMAKQAQSLVKKSKSPDLKVSVKKG